MKYNPNVVINRLLRDREVYKGYDLLEDVFIDGKLVRDESLAEIRARVLK